VTGNTIQPGWGANGVIMLDVEATPTLTSVVTGNLIQTDTSCGCYDPTNNGYSAIALFSLKSFVISFNTLQGGISPGIYVLGGPGVISWNVIPGAFVGIWVDVALKVLVTGNLIQNSGFAGIEVTDGSSHVTVAHNFVQNSGGFDLYWDQTGAGDLWYGNICQTSSPSGLC
jgi:parallel beta helix pectate lyase-like protein